jgi:hypothetical protein
MLPLVEMANGIDLPDETIGHPLVRRMEDLANLVIAFTNDLFSFEKEVLFNQNPNNLLLVILTQHQLMLPHALSWSLGLLDGYLDEYGRLAKVFEGQAELRTYIEGMTHWVCASQKWYWDSGRYRSPTSPFSELRSGNAYSKL